MTSPLPDTSSTHHKQDVNAASNASHPVLADADLADIHQQMLAFARNQLNDHALADDMVQEALIKTMTHASSFKGKSAYKSWVFAILKNTIIDELRKRKREIQLSQLERQHDNDQTEALMDVLFDDTGHWHKMQRPAKWQTPDEALEKQDFWLVLEACLDHLPAQHARIFLMREYIGLDTGEVCDECDISSSKFYVVMHRARLKLQTCLSTNWFDEV